MRILYVTPFPPSPRFSGTGIRLHNTLRALSDWGRIRLVALVRPEDRGLLEDCRPWCDEVVAVDATQAFRSLWPEEGRSRWASYRDAVGTLTPASLRFRDADAFRSLVARVGADAPDLTWIAKSWLAGTMTLPREGRVVVDFDDLEYRVLARTARLTPWYGSKWLYEPLEIWKQRRFERGLCRRVTRALVCTERDRGALGGDNVRVLPNCIEVAPVASPVDEVPGRMLFVGKMDYGPNVDAVQHFCRSILPAIRDREPRAHLHVVGREPSAAVRALHTGSDVVVTGTVSDVAPHFEAASVVVVPLRIGGGTRVKILEALGRRKAVVSTPVGAEGLEVEDRVQVAIAGPGRDFAVRCADLLVDEPGRRKLGDAGRRLVEQRYSLEVFRRTVNALLAEVMGPNP
jgi:glycosyltransferase involved in cell wall biosynthesis